MSRRYAMGVVAWLLAVCWCGGRAGAADFEVHVKPIIESGCLNCHNEKKAEGNLRLDTRQGALQGGDSGPALVPGKPEESPLYTTTQLAPDEGRMPPDGAPLSKLQAEQLKAWIAAGADWPADAQLRQQPRIDFVLHVRPILETHCLACHRSDNAEGDFSLTTRDSALTSGASAPCIVPFAPDESVLYLYTVADKDAEELMPPASKGGPLPRPVTERLQRWIAQGAPWPDGITLEPKAASPGGDSPDDLELVRRIHQRILERSAERGEADMADYTGKIPQTGVDYHMVAIAGGEFLMGSPPDEPHRQEIEGPQTKVQIAPFWMGKHEVTWDEYEPFMITQVDRAKNGARMDYDPQKHGMVDAVSQPTPPYMEMSFGMGQKGYPAISMTQHAAHKYCQWLSAQTGHFYRLPTEAEWEYACRAGTTTAYSFGDDVSQLGQYGWFYDNSNEKYQKVGLKKPNPWGLYDMHGNVMEWTADQFHEDYFARIGDSAKNPWLEPQRLYPRSVRGGGWDDDPEQLRSAARRGSADHWKQQDPQLPKSIWYHTDARWLGFRIVRPLEIPSPDQMYLYWNSAADKR